MNKLDLNAYGVQEMSNAEMRETDGGFLAAIGLVVVAGVFLLIDYLQDGRIDGYIRI